MVLRADRDFEPESWGLRGLFLLKGKKHVFFSGGFVGERLRSPMVITLIDVVDRKVFFFFWWANYIFFSLVFLWFLPDIFSGL